jgi:hypothetical protein
MTGLAHKDRWHDGDALWDHGVRAEYIRAVASLADTAAMMLGFGLSEEVWPERWTHPASTTCVREVTPGRTSSLGVTSRPPVRLNRIDGVSAPWGEALSVRMM